MSNTMSPTEFEKLLVSYQQRISPNAKVEHNKVIRGKSNTTNQCDAIMTFIQGSIEFTVLFECKYHKKKIDLPKLREFITKVHEIGASKGVFVAKEGYTKQSIEFARFHNIELYTLIDYDFQNSKEVLQVPINVNFINVKKSYIEIFSGEDLNPMDLNTISSPDFKSIKNEGLIYDKNAEIWYTLGGFIEDIISKHYDEFLVNNNLVIDKNNYFTPSYNILTNERKFDIPLCPLLFKIKVDFEEKKYHTKIDIDKLLGFDNSKSKTAFSLQTKSFNIKDILNNMEDYFDENINVCFSISIKNKLLPTGDNKSFKFILNDNGEVRLN